MAFPDLTDNSDRDIFLDARYDNMEVRCLAGDDRIIDSDTGHNINGNQGFDEINGNGGNDFLRGGGQDDFLFGGAGSDTVHGNLGSDFVFGGSEGDTVRGGGGNDFIFGEDGDDFLYGDPGTDELTGGAGSDTFVLGGIYAENLSNAAIADVIKDFTVGVDSIGLAGGLTPDQVLPIASGADTLFMLGDKILARVEGVILPGFAWNYRTGLQD